MSLDVSTMALKAGKVTFDVTNAKTSTVQHEMLVVRLTPAQEADLDTLPYNDKENTIDEESSKIQDLGEVSELDPGHEGQLTVTLKPGPYLLFCNVPGHFKMGMYKIVHAN